MSVVGGYNHPRMAPGTGYGKTRRWIAGGAIAIALLGVPAAAAASSQPAHAAAKTATSILHTTVPAKGKYLLIVWVRSRTKHSRVVDVYLSGQRMQQVRANPWWGAAVYYTLSLSATKLAVRTVNAPPAVEVRATLSLRKTTSAPSTSHGLTSGGAPSGSTTAPATTTTTTTTTATPPSTTPTTPPSTPPSTTPPADPYGPFSTVQWQDNFAQDYVSGGSAPNQLPSTSTWNLDNWGSCGPGTLSATTTSAQNAYLTSNGLAITAAEVGTSGHWNSAQIDSQGHVSFGPGSTIEARIMMPAGVDMCPAFWLLSDNPPPNQGEIDIVEAPAFTSQATAAIFTLHGPGATSQQFEANETAVGGLAGVWHNFAVTWTATSIVWTIDGTPYATATANSLVAGASWSTYGANGPYHLIFDLAVGGWPCADQPYGASCSPATSATMYVQWVKVFR
jgi:beta-glucanase (GH16 family)